LLVRYADGSPDFRMRVHVPVVVKHMSTAIMFWRTCMKWHYSPDLQAESRILSNGQCLSLTKLFHACIAERRASSAWGTSAEPKHLEVVSSQYCFREFLSKLFSSQIICFLWIRRVEKQLR